MRFRSITIPLFAFLFTGTILAQDAKKDGWWIRVFTDKPASQMMGFYVGATENSYGFWRVWSPGTPSEFDVSDEYRTSPTLFLLAQTSSGQKCALCLMYKSRGVKYVEFDLEEGIEVKQTDEDKRCR